MNALKEPKESLEELWKYCKSDAIIEIINPCFNNIGAYNDLRVNHFFCHKSFEALVDERYNLKRKNKFEIAELKLTPTRIGKFFPSQLREKLSIFIGGLISEVHVKLKVKKEIISSENKKNTYYKWSFPIKSTF